jgi:alpha-mannosidase
VIPTGLKLAEKSDELVLRMYEGAGMNAAFAPTIAGAPTSVETVNFLEDDLSEVPCTLGRVDLELRPFEIKTIRFRVPANARADAP